MKYIFLVNPIAGSGRAKRKWRILQQYLIEQSFDYEIYFSKATGDIQKRLGNQDYTDPQQSIIIMGGDGTLHEAINGVLHNVKIAQQIPIGYISAGSGNDFARLYSLSNDPVLAFKRIDQAMKYRQFKMIDIGKYTNQQTSMITYFINNMGIGIDATAVHFANDSQTKRWLNKLHMGQWSYLIAALKSLVKQEAFEIMVEDANRQQIRTQKGYFVTIANNPYFGGGIKILPDADPTDGLLDIIIVDKPQHIFRLIWLLGALFRGNHYQYSEVNHIQTKQMILKTTRPEYSHLDGESVSPQIFDAKIQLIKYPICF